MGNRERSQPVPPAIVWESLQDPHRPGARPWLDLLADEVEPKILNSSKPDLIVWSSLWLDRPHERIRFDIRPDGEGCRVRWTLLTSDEPPTDSKLGHMRHRINLLINDRLRRSYGQ